MTDMRMTCEWCGDRIDADAGFWRGGHPVHHKCMCDIDSHIQRLQEMHADMPRKYAVARASIRGALEGLQRFYPDRDIVEDLDD